MSEAGLHVLRARLQGGILNKARRGELFIRPPIGFAYDALGRVVLDPDQQIQRTIRLCCTIHGTPEFCVRPHTDTQGCGWRVPSTTCISGRMAYVQAIGSERRKSPPREGPALLQGLIICGKCGRRVILRYHTRQAGLCPEYVCQHKGIENAEPPCQRIPGAEVDRVLSDILLELVNPVALDVALTVQQEVQARLDESDRLREQHVDRARYEAELAQRRYMRVDPENRFGRRYTRSGLESETTGAGR
jgi:hypothetical protein